MYALLQWNEDFTHKHWTSQTPFVLKSLRLKTLALPGGEGGGPWNAPSRIPASQPKESVCPAEVVWVHTYPYDMLGSGKPQGETMRTMIAGLAGWARMQQNDSEALRLTDTALTVVGTLLVAVTFAILW